MPWANARPVPRSDRYGWAYQKERRDVWKPIVDAGRGYCQQGIAGNGSSGACLYQDRWINPATRWCVGHNDAGTEVIGPVHHRCNARDAAVRGNRASKQRRRTSQRW